MKFKKILLAPIAFIVMVFGTKSALWAQKSQEEKVMHITEKLSKKLELNASQKEAVYRLNLMRAKGHQKAYEADRKKEIIVAVVTEWENGLKSVLTKAQLKKLRIK